MSDLKSGKKSDKKKFSPFDIFEELKNSNLDPSVFDKVDERDFAKAPNFLDWSIEPKFANTTALPKQIEIGTKLCQDWCPRCSNPGYIDSLFDQTIGNIKDNIQFLIHGVCPKCKSNRIELAHEFNIDIKNELVGAMGQRCVPLDTLVYSNHGLIPMQEVTPGHVLSHGPVSEKFDAGVQEVLELVTDGGWVLRGAKMSHIVATLVDSEILYKPLKNVEKGDTLLLHSPRLWPERFESHEMLVEMRKAGAEIELGSDASDLPTLALKASELGQREFLLGVFGAETIYSVAVRCPDLAKKLQLMLLNFGVLTEYLGGVVSAIRHEPKIIDGKEFFTQQVAVITDKLPIPMADVSVPLTNAYTGDGFLHHNSGKTKLVGLLASYITHRFLKVPNPLRYFGQPSGELLLGTFSALTLEQASQTLWESYKGFVGGSPWFSQYHSFLRGEEKRLGVELLHDLKNSILYPHKQMLWHCTGSQDRKMRGKTRIFAAIDELGWFIMDDSKPDLQNMNADAVYTALSNSLATMRMKYRILLTRGEFDAPPILMANVSSPSSAKDKIMRLLKDANRNTKILAVQLPSWQCNSDYTYDTLRAEFAHVEESVFMRDFGVEPPLAQSPYISDETILSRVAKGALTTDYDAVEIFDSVDKFKSAKFRMLGQSKGAPRLVTFDLGTTKNGLAACVFNLASGKPALEYVLTIAPNPAAKIRINIADVYDNFTEPLVKALNVKYVFFDRWQSLDQIERLRMLGITAEVYSLTYKDMDSVRGYISSEAVTIPKLHKPIQEIISDYVADNPQWQADPIGTLCIQLLTVRDNGNRMMKPLQGDDDIFRAFCLGVVKLFDPKIKLDMQNMPAGMAQSHLGMNNRAIGTMKPRSAKMGGLSGGKVSVDGIGAAFSRNRNR